MNVMTEDREATDFLKEDHGAVPARPVKPWKVLVVDDEPAVHDVTRLALGSVDFDGRPVEFLHAYSAAEGRDIIAKHTDIALGFIDVVMETEHAGLDLIYYVREQLGNHMIRLILRTGQPGQAPEILVLRRYEINDYKEKTELTAQKLYTTVLTGLRSYRDLAALEANRQGLKRVIGASAQIFRISGLTALLDGVLAQLVAVLHLDENSLVISRDSVAVENRNEQLSVVAATGKFAQMKGVDPQECLPAHITELVHQSLRTKKNIVHGNEYAGYFSPRPGHEDVIYVSGTQPLTVDDSDLIELFLHNAAIAYENGLLREEVEGTQRDIVYMLGEAIESRSRETGQHVRRVSEYCALIGRGLGLPEREVEIIRLAAPLHDFGKIGIPDAVLHKQGKLDDTEWEVMKTHPALGEEMLARSEREVLRAAAIIAGYHHERWDGKGYPRGLAGEDIPLYGRIGAVADVFDALGTRRCYKEAWPAEHIRDYLIEQRGTQLDPAIVDWVIGNWKQMLAIRLSYPDD